MPPWRGVRGTEENASTAISGGLGGIWQQWVVVPDREAYQSWWWEGLRYLDRPIRRVLAALVLVLVIVLVIQLLIQ